MRLKWSFVPLMAQPDPCIQVTSPAAPSLFSLRRLLTSMLYLP
jgi:hypothetical protein